MKNNFFILFNFYSFKWKLLNVLVVKYIYYLRLFCFQNIMELFSSIPSTPALAPPGVLALEDLVEIAKHWALINGMYKCLQIFQLDVHRRYTDVYNICLGLSQRSTNRARYCKDAVEFVPFTLLPSPFPKSEYEKIFKIQPLINKLMHKAVHDHEFLTNALKT